MSIKRPSSEFQKETRRVRPNTNVEEEDKYTLESKSEEEDRDDSSVGSAETEEYEEYEEFEEILVVRTPPPISPLPTTPLSEDDEQNFQTPPVAPPRIDPPPLPRRPFPQEERVHRELEFHQGENYDVPPIRGILTHPDGDNLLDMLGQGTIHSV